MKMEKENNANQSVPEVKPEEFGKDDELEGCVPIEESDEPDLSKIKPVEGGVSVDLEKYHKKDTKIDLVQVIQVPSNYTSFIKDAKGNETNVRYMQWVLKVSGGVLETIGEGEDKIEFRASELFNLVQSNKGELTGFPTGEKSNLMIFMKDLGIEAPEKLESLQKVKEALMDQDAQITSYKKEQNGKTKTYLKFRY